MKTLVVLAILAIAGLANAQNSANANATANATVICPISIHNNSNLEFGTITNSAAGGTVTVPTSGAATYSGVVATTGSHAGPTPHSADFTVGGQGAFGYTVTSTIVTNFSGVGAVLSNLTWAVPASPGGTTTIFPCDSDNDGGAGDAYEGTAPGSDDQACGCVTDDLKLGGKITLTSAANGAYSATVNVAIAYN